MNVNKYLWGLLVGALFAGAGSCGAQSLYPLQLQSIEANNPVLRAAAATAEAMSRDALTGLSLPNPEVSVDYMVGVDPGMENKTDIEVTQGFDFATLSGAKRRVAKAEGEVTRAALVASRSELLLQAESALIEYNFRRAMCDEMVRRHKLLHAMHDAAKEALAQGSITRLEYNKIELEALGADSEMEMARIELEAAARAVVSLNGGQAIELPVAWPEASLPADFDAWVAEAAARSGELTTLRAALSKSTADVELRRKEGWPEFSVGYIGEIVRGDTYHGAGLSFSLPLWGNHGRVKAAKALQRAGELELAGAEEQFRLTKLNQYERTRQLAKTCAEMQKLFDRISESNQAYLDLALKAGTITVLEYLTEQEDFTSHYIKYIETRRDFLQARAELYAETL